MSTRLSVRGAGERGRRHRRSLIEEQGEDDVATDGTFSDLITNESLNQQAAEKYLATTLAKSPTDVHGSGNKTLPRMDGVYGTQRSEDTPDTSYDYVYEDEVEPETTPSLIRRTKTGQQFGKSLNSNLRSAAKTLVNKRRKYDHGTVEAEHIKHEEEEEEDEQKLERHEAIGMATELTTESETSTLPAVIDDDNQSDNSSSGPTPETTVRSDTDDIVEINTPPSQTAQRTFAAVSHQPAIEHDFQIKGTDAGGLQTEKPATDDINNERDLADNYEVDSKEPTSPGTPPQGINQADIDWKSSPASGIELRLSSGSRNVQLMLSPYGLLLRMT